MFRPPRDPQERPRVTNPTWRSILVSYALGAAIPLLLWAITSPLAGTASLVSIAGLVVGGLQAYKLHRCFHRCQEFTVQLGETAQITVTQLPANDTA